MQIKLIPYSGGEGVENCWWSAIVSGPDQSPFHTQVEMPRSLAEELERRIPDMVKRLERIGQAAQARGCDNGYRGFVRLDESDFD